MARRRAARRPARWSPARTTTGPEPRRRAGPTTAIASRRCSPRSEDPWDYTNGYEQRKYEQTLSLLPAGPIGAALELACAEGHFTVQLAPRVGTLVAADISEHRAGARRGALRAPGNVSFRELDLVARPAARRASS